MTLALCSTTLWFFPLRCMSIWVWDGAPTLRNITNFQQTKPYLTASHLAQLAIEIMLIGNFAAQRCWRKRRCRSRGWSFLVLLRWCAFPLAGGLVEVARLETWQPCCQPCVVLAGKMLFHLEVGKWQNERVHIQDQTCENDVKARSQMEQWRPCGLPSSSLLVFWPLALNFWGIGTAEFRLFSLLREVK